MKRLRGNTQGFTLMEILFVLLIIAMVISFALPAFRAVRYDVRNAQAQAALKKLAEARRSFYQASRGADITPSNFNASDAKSLAATTCSNPSASGVPGASQDAKDVGQLFACGFLNWRDFVNLPYVFYICSLNGQGAAPCKSEESNTERVYAGALGTTAAGSKYQSSKYYMYVPLDMQVKDNAN